MNKQAIICLALAVLILAMLVSCGSRADMVRTAYRVQSGDTLWELYEKYGGNSIKPQKWIYEVMRINGMRDVALFVGDEIMILEVRD